MQTPDEFSPGVGRFRTFDIKALGQPVYEHDNGNTADVAVIIPLYNYENYISECLQSVIDQDLELLSVTIVNDASTDKSEDLAVEILQGNKERFSAARVIRHRKNQGLAMTRNSGIMWSTEPYLFMLDADNRLRSPALSRLLEALVVSEREFAYSQLYRFGEMMEVGVADVWDVERFRHGNYIDGMALIKRSAVLAVNGYRNSEVQDGWEDFDLWCKFAELGYAGVYLPELLCEYRVHQSSMVHTRTNYKRRALSLEIVLRHPTLFGGDETPPFVDFYPPDRDA